MNILLRAKQLACEGKDLFAPPALRFFLYNQVDANFFHSHPEALYNYELLDDSDIWTSVKVWEKSDDKILSILARNLLERRIFRVKIQEEPFSEEELLQLVEYLADKVEVSKEDAHYLMSVNTIQKDMYDVHDDHIAILYKDGTIKDISDASEILNVALLSKKIRKYYLCYQRFWKKFLTFADW